MDSSWFIQLMPQNKTPASSANPGVEEGYGVGIFRPSRGWGQGVTGHTLRSTPEEPAGYLARHPALTHGHNASLCQQKRYEVQVGCRTQWITALSKNNPQLFYVLETCPISMLSISKVEFTTQNIGNIGIYIYIHRYTYINVYIYICA